MHKVISLKYRPKDFDELYNQEHVKKTLVNALKNRKIANAYLFAGPRGVGKTTTARILAKGLNCEKGVTPKPCNKCTACVEIKESRSLDVIEIDGASNRNVEEVRNIRENIRFKPTRGRYRIYIIDEVHMLTNEAFNALLKTLEEPPPHAVFIFATTAPHKVPQTVISRCQRFDFRKITEPEIVKRLSLISELEKIEIEEEALWTIALSADGSMRDAESILEQVSSYVDHRIKKEDVEGLLGIVPSSVYEEFIRVIKNPDDALVFEFVDKIVRNGYDLVEFYFGLIKFLRTIWLQNLGIGDRKVKNINISEEKMDEIITYLLLEEERFKKTLVQRVFLEIVLLKIKKILKKEGFKKTEEEKNRAETKKEKKSPIEVLRGVLQHERPMLAAHLGFVKNFSCEEDKIVLHLENLKNIHAEILKKEKKNIERIYEKKVGEKITIEFKEEKAKGEKENEVEKKIKKVIELFDGEVFK